jgi:hypothetical protein
LFWVSDPNEGFLVGQLISSSESGVKSFKALEDGRQLNASDGCYFEMNPYFDVDGDVQDMVQVIIICPD